MRVTRVALEELGLDADLQRHGIERQIFALPLADNAKGFLTGREPLADINRPSAARIVSAALEKWVLPRSARDLRFKAFCVADLEAQLREPATYG
jgi:hypothetical protein